MRMITFGPNTHIVGPTDNHTFAYTVCGKTCDIHQAFPPIKHWEGPFEWMLPAYALCPKCRDIVERRWDEAGVRWGTRG